MFYLVSQNCKKCNDVVSKNLEKNIGFLTSIITSSPVNELVTMAIGIFVELIHALCRKALVCVFKAFTINSH